MKKARQATLVEALIPIIFLIIILGLSLTLFKVDPQISYLERSLRPSLVFIDSVLSGKSLKTELFKPLRWRFRQF